MADHTITITVTNIGNLVGLYPAGGRGYCAMSNQQFNDCMAVTPTSEVPLPVSGISNYITPVESGDTVTWIMPLHESMAALSIDEVTFHDSVNFVTVFDSQPQAVAGTLGQQWQATVREAYGESDYPFYLSYRVQFSFAYEGDYYYFQFDPLVQPRERD